MFQTLKSWNRGLFGGIFKRRRIVANERTTRKHAASVERSAQTGALVTVTSAGRLEVDGRKLFRDVNVQRAVTTLRNIPMPRRSS